MHRLFALIIAACVTLFATGCDTSSASREWFRNYFTDNAKDSDSSQRIFMTWFAGDRQRFSKDIWIGGDQSESTRFFNLVETMLEGHRSANVDKSSFLLELVLDAPTAATQESILRSLSTRFPDSFKVTMADAIATDRLPPKDVFEHHTIGNAVIAADALRPWYLHDDNYAINVYIDVDHFMGKLENLSRYTDHKVFGREVAVGAIYYPPRNNDYLIARRAPLQKFTNIKARATKLYRDNMTLFDHYKNRADFVTDPSPDNAFATYWAKVTALVEYQRKNRDHLINLSGAIIRTGPSLWVDSANADNPDVLLNDAFTEEVISTQTWKGGMHVPLGKQLITVNTMSSIKLVKAFDAPTLVEQRKRIVDIVLTLNILGWDYNFFGHFDNKEMHDRVAQKIDVLWSEARELISRHVDKDDYYEDLIKVTGGLYLALTK